MSIYTKEQQTRTVTNEKTGKTKTFKSTGVDAKGKHFFTSLDNAKQREFATGEKPSLKTGIPVGRTKSGDLGVLKTEDKKTEKKKSGPKIGVLTGRRAKRNIKGDITKKMSKGGVEGGTAPIRLGLSKSQIGEMLSNAILRKDMKNPKRALTKVAEDEFIAGLDDLIQNPRARRNKYKGAIADGKSIYSEHGYSLRSKDKKISKDKKARKKPEPRSGTIRNKTKKVKKLNMGGVMKNRGGTFKGTF